MQQPTGTQTYALPSGSEWCQALVALAKRAQEYLDAGLQTDAQLATRINQVHVEWIEWPKGREERG